MKTFTATEPQLQEIAGRLNALTVQGLANVQHLTGILAVLEAIANPPAASNVVEIPRKDADHG